VGADVAVAEPEPGFDGAVGPDLLQRVPGLARPSPALLLVDAGPEGVHHRVEVGGDVQPVQRDVVAGVADDGDLEWTLAPAAGRDQAAEEPGGADAAGERGDPQRRGAAGCGVTGCEVAGGERVAGWSRWHAASLTDEPRPLRTDRGMTEG